MGQERRPPYVNTAAAEDEPVRTGRRRQTERRCWRMAGTAGCDGRRAQNNSMVPAGSTKCLHPRWGEVRDLVKEAHEFHVGQEVGGA